MTSSRNNSLGLVASARASSSFFFSPIVSPPASMSRLSSRPTSSSAEPALVRASAIDIRRVGANSAPVMTLSMTDISANGLTTWKVLAIPR